MDPGGPTFVPATRSSRWVTAGTVLVTVGALAILVGVEVDPWGPIAGAGIGLAATALAWRLLLMGAVVDGHGVLVRRTFWSRRYAWSEVRDIDVGPPRWAQQPSLTARLHLTSGRVVPLAWLVRVDTPRGREDLRRIVRSLRHARGLPDQPELVPDLAPADAAKAKRRVRIAQGFAIVGGLLQLALLFVRNDDDDGPDRLQFDPDVLSVELGECFVGGLGIVPEEPIVDEGGWLEVHLHEVRCDEPHDGELVAELPITGATGGYPGGDALGALATQVCDERVRTVDGHRPPLRIVVGAPRDAYDWSQPSQREIRCAVVRQDGQPLTGPVSIDVLDASGPVSLP